MIELKIEKIVVEPIETKCYLILLNNELAVVDPGGEADKIIVEIEKSFSRHSRGGGNSNLILSKYILLTHGHYDHVMAINDLKKKYGFKVVISEKDKDTEGINRSEEHTSELQTHSFISYAVVCLKKKKKNK